MPGGMDLRTLQSDMLGTDSLVVVKVSLARAKATTSCITATRIGKMNL